MTSNINIIKRNMKLVVKCFQLTMDISKLDNKVKELVQKIAIDEKEKREQK